MARVFFIEDIENLREAAVGYLTLGDHEVVEFGRLAGVHEALERHQPDLIIADEPTTALDVTIQAQILFEVQKLVRERGTALIWITHDLSIVSGLADQVCVMYAGRIVERGPVAEIIGTPCILTPGD